MRKLGWYAVSAVVAAMILGGVLLLAANLYVQSHTAQERIRLALVNTLGMAVELKKTTVTPWEGLRIDGIVVRPENSVDNFLTADSFRARFAFLPLLRKHFQVQQVLLDRPELSWAQNSNGRWQFPPDEQRVAKRHGKAAVEPAEPAEVEPPAPPVALETPVPTPSSAPATAETPEPAVLPTPESHPVDNPVSVAVELLKMRHGTLNFLDVRRRPLGRFEEVNLDSRMAGLDHASGAVWFGKALLPRVGLNMTDFHADFTYDEKGLTLPNAKGALAGGTIDLVCHIDLQEPGSPFTASCHLENVSLDELITQAGGRPKLAEGRLRGDIKASGDPGIREGRRATARIELVDGRFSNLSLLQTIGEALRIQDLSRLQFKKAQLDCELEGTVLRVRPLVLVSSNLRITAEGDYHIEDDRLGLRARLTIDQAVGRQLPEFIESNFQPCGVEAPGCRYVDFDVTGTLAKPKSNLLTKVLAGTAGGLLQNLFAPRKKHEKKDTGHSENQSPPPTPANPVNTNGDGI